MKQFDIYNMIHFVKRNFVKLTRKEKKKAKKAKKKKKKRKKKEVSVKELTDTLTELSFVSDKKR